MNPFFASEVNTMFQQFLLLAVESHADRVGIVEVDAMHLAPGIGGRLELRIIAAHLGHLIPEVHEEDGLDVLDDEILSGRGNEVEGSRILLFRIRDAHRRQSLVRRLWRERAPPLLQDADDAGISHRVVVEPDGIPEGMDQVLTNERLKFQIDNRLTHDD